jgi:ABC-type Mn2+/Zn2+ transport system permease subunit
MGAFQRAVTTLILPYVLLCLSIQSAEKGYMRKLRQILLTEYIGAIIIGFLLAQALAATISTIVQAISFYMEGRSRSSVFGGRAGFEFGALVPPAVSVILEVVVAFLLISWLYWRSDTPVDVVDEKILPEKQA